MMVNWLDFLRCPHTGSELQLEQGYLVSQQGGYRYPIVFGIPDLRLLMSKNFSSFEILFRRSNPAAESLMGRLYYQFSPWAEKLFAYVADQHVVIARKEYICADEQADAKNLI